MHRWNTILLIAFSLMSNIAFGQYLENYEKKALTAFHSKDYASALLFSEKVLEIDSMNIASMFVAGEAARLSNDFDKAEAYLERIPENAKVGYYSVTDYQLATVKLDLNKEGEARRYFQKYIDAHNEPNNLFAYLAMEAIKTMDEEDKAKVNPMNVQRLAENVNTPNPDMAPLRYADKVYFTSIKEVPGERRKEKKMVSRIYESRGNYPAKPFAANPGKELLSAGDITLAPDASRVYYTICKGDFLKSEGCEIWFREREYEGGWGPPKRVPDEVNKRGTNAKQPSIAWDQTRKQYILYFSSDRPNGRGGFDIWCSAVGRDGSFSEPVNMPFNTPQDDITPFFHQPTQTLFFSSNGWPGKGGFDIFREQKNKEGEWRVPENLGDVLNTNYDETYYSFHGQSQSAYLVSNRPDAADTAAMADNLDIFQARVFAAVELKVFRSLDNNPVFAPKVELKEMKTGEQGAFAARKEQNNIPLRLETGKHYQLTVLADGYEPYTFEFSTEGFSYFIELTRQIYLRRPLDP
ncbi:MAG: PD40 domain-containing protein [Saprospiraceae bacterium]|nr:PD40 domain-containing protein [Saprospiraceae bacterium]